MPFNQSFHMVFQIFEFLDGHIRSICLDKVCLHQKAFMDNIRTTPFDEAENEAGNSSSEEDEQSRNVSSFGISKSGTTKFPINHLPLSEIHQASLRLTQFCSTYQLLLSSFTSVFAAKISNSWLRLCQLWPSSPINANSKTTPIAL